MSAEKSKTQISSDYAMTLLAHGKPLDNFLITGKVDLTSKYIDIGFKESLVIRDCFVEELYAWGVTFDELIILHNTEFYKFSFDTCVFQKNLEIRSCIFDGEIYIGHHQGSSDFICENNTFKGVVRFIDYWFGGKVSVKGNDFQKGTCLLDNDNNGDTSVI